MEKEKDSAFVLLRKVEGGVTAMIRVDLNRPPQEVENGEEEEEDQDQAEERDTEIEADLYLQPKSGEGMLFSFLATSSGEVSLLSLNHLPADLCFPTTPEKDLKNAQRYAGVSFEQLDERLQEQLYTYLTEKFLTKDVTAQLHDLHLNEENLEYVETLQHLKNFVENN